MKTIKIDRDFLQLHYVDKKKSITDIAKISEYTKSTIRLRLIEYGMIRSQSDGFKISKWKMGQHLKGKKMVFTDERKNNMKKSAIRRGEKTAKGYSLKPSGYYEITRGEHKGRSLHSVIIEESIGRRLKKDEVVHHRNGIKTDNRIENLQLMTRSEHCSLHAKISQSNGVSYDISKHSNKGELHSLSKLKEIDVVCILKSKESNLNLAQKHNVSASCIRHIKSRRTWTHVSL